MMDEFSIHLCAFMLRVKDNCETAVFIQTICVSLARVNNQRIEILRPIHQTVYYNDKLNIFLCFFHVAIEKSSRATYDFKGR